MPAPPKPSEPQGGTSGSGGSGSDADTAPATFRHPGVLVTKGQLDFIKGKLADGAEPWTAAFNLAKSDPLAAPTYVPMPRASVNCGSNNVPDEGCTEEKRDADAAYTNALLWTLTGDEAYAKKAIEIMNAWSAVLKTHTLSNALVAVRLGRIGLRARAARSSGTRTPAWPQARNRPFRDACSQTAYLPFTLEGTHEIVGARYGLVANGNWEAVMIEASIGIGVFTEDRPRSTKAVPMWKARVPSYIYMKKDGDVPVNPPGMTYDAATISIYWGNQPTFTEDGIGPGNLPRLPPSRIRIRRPHQRRGDRAHPRGGPLRDREGPLRGRVRVQPSVPRRRAHSGVALRRDARHQERT